MPLTQSRCDARGSSEGATVPVSEQNRALWDEKLMQAGQAEGKKMLLDGLAT
ncbi:MAG: DUF6596 domain-containing protein [Sulfitobacter sp.]